MRKSVNPVFITPEKQHSKTEIITVEDLKSLPEGVCITSKDPEKTGSEELGYFILELISKVPQNRIPSLLSEAATSRKNSPEYLIGQICAHIDRGGVYKDILTAIDERFPMLCWFRGGDYLETPSGAPALTNLSGIGANGFLGDVGAIRYAKKDYKSHTHQMPVLYMIPFKSLLEGVEDGVINLSTEHDTDVVVSPKGNGFDEWALKNVLVVDLGNSPDDFEKARRIFKQKSVALDVHNFESKPLAQEIDKLMKDPAVVEFIEFRNIIEEDYYLIRNALVIPRDVWIQYQNVPSLNRQNLQVVLEAELNHMRQKVPETYLDDPNYQCVETMLAFVKKYDWVVALGLNTVMKKVALKNPGQFKK